MKLKKVWFPFIRYYNPYLLSKFLHRMAAEGWFPGNISLLSYFCISFVKAEKKEYCFAVDFSLMSSKGYLALYNSFNWIHLGKMSNLNIWYKEAEGRESTEIYTDSASKIRNFKRYAIFLWAGMIPTALAFVALSVMLVVSYAYMSFLKLIVYSFLCIGFLCLFLTIFMQYTKYLRSIREERNDRYK